MRRVGGSRRAMHPRLLAVLLVLGGLAPTTNVGGLTSSAAAAVSPTTPPPVQAVSADDLVDGFGLCVHVGFLDTPYRDAAVVRDALSDLGVRHVRDELTLNTPWQYASMRTVAATGVKFDLITGNPTD